MPDPEQTAARRARRWRPLAALAVAGGLALRTGGSLAGAPDLTGDVAPVLHVERGLAPVRAALRAGDRVALLVSDDDLGPWYATQYALAPARVIRVRARDCLDGPPERCLDGVTHLLAPAGDAAAVAARTGLVPVATSPRGVLLGRVRP